MKLILSNDIEIHGTNKSTLEDIKQKLTIANPKWFENERMGYSNRGVPRILEYYMEDNGFAVPRGFLSELLSIYPSAEIIDNRRLLKPVKFTFEAESRSYQKTAVDIMLSEDQGVLQAPTGSGKTVMALNIIAQRKQPTLIIVHTKELLNQWKDRAENFLKIPKKEIGTIGDGKKTIGKKLTIAMVQTLYKCAQDVYPHIGHLVVDETHRVASRCFDDAVSWFDCKYMLGLSATPYRRDKLTKLIYWFIGPKLHEIPISEMVDQKAILPIDIKIRYTLFTTTTDMTAFYSHGIKELTENEQRNKMIIEDAIVECQNGVVLILSDRKTHCDYLSYMCKCFEIKPVILTGDTPTIERNNIIERVNSGKEKIVIATGQLIGEGFDCKNLSCLSIATPIRFSGRLLQYVGRVLRPAKGKDKAIIYDYVDQYVKQLVNAAKDRVRTYNREFGTDEKLFKK